MFKWENWFTEVRNPQFFWEEPVDCWAETLIWSWIELLQFQLKFIELSFCNFIENFIGRLSPTCCCHQINSQLLISDWKNQITRKTKREGRKISFSTLTFFLFCVGFFGQLANILHFRLFCEINNKRPPVLGLLHWIWDNLDLSMFKLFNKLSVFDMLVSFALISLREIVIQFYLFWKLQDRFGWIEDHAILIIIIILLIIEVVWC